MHRILRFVTLLLPVTLLSAADAPWVSKRVPEWTEKDAFQILTDSPWVKKTPATLTPLLNAAMRRDGGDMNAQGGGHGGVGLQGIGNLVGTGGAPVRKGGPEGERPPKLLIRWETALPVCAAEFKARDTSAPEVDGEDYAIAVYDVSLKLASIELKGMADALKKVAVLKIEGRKDVRPSRVSILELGEGLATVVYFFPRSAHITADDQRLEFSAQVGRIVFAQYFYPAEMKFLGKLEL